MQDAPHHEPVYTYPGPPQLDPERVRDYLFGDVHYLPLAETPLDDPPPGQILLVRPVPPSEDPQDAKAQERDIKWLRGQLQNLILARDFRALSEQEGSFGFFVCKLMGQRGFGAFMTSPTCFHWLNVFSSRNVVEQAERLYERHGDVRLRTDLGNGKFSLRAPSTRVGQRSDEVIVSLRPVVDALSMKGLWVDRPDERFRDLARVMVRLGRDEHRRVGRMEFTRRWSRGEQ